jgi:transcriptional regulator with XRE-family HTH domain
MIDPLVADLREWRHTRGLRLVEVAALMSSNKQTLARWQNGSVTPSLHTLRRWSDALDLDIAVVGLDGKIIPPVCDCENPRQRPKGHRYHRLHVDPVVLVLTQMRERAGLTQEQVAHRAGFALDSLRAWEAGDGRYPMLPLLRRWCAVLDVDLAIIEPDT